MKTKIYLLGLLVGCSFSADATLYNAGTLAGGSSIGTITDNSTIGLSSSIGVSGESASLSALSLTFVLQGGYSGDLYAYLRLGNTSGSPSYDLSALVHGQTLSAGSPTTYTIDFNTAGFQSTFAGEDPNDTWTLYFADLSPGDQTTFNGWSLTFAPVPEPANVALAILGVLGAGALVWRIRRNAPAQA